MPAVSKVKTPCIAQLASELGYASKPTLLRHLDRIGEMGPQIDAEGIYPEDWIVFRITGYRPDIESPMLVPGESLRGDLSAIAEQISEYAKLTYSDLNEPYETINSLAQRWSVSRKTIERYRRLGLIARRIDLGKGRRSVVFVRSAVEWFESLNHDRLGKAARFDRIGESQIQLFERLALEYRRRLGWTRSQSAHRIAMRTGHSHEGVRKALIRIDRDRKSPIFTEPGPSTPRDHRFALRAVMRGIEPSEIARHQNRSHNSVLRAIKLARYALLKEYELNERASMLDSLTETEVLDAIPVQTNLNTRGCTDLSELIETMQSPRTWVAYEERSWVRAYHYLIERASTRARALSHTAPSGVTLDEIETDLRWATKLKLELVRAHFGLILSTIEHKVSGDIELLSPIRIVFLLFGGIQVASESIDRFDPLSTSRLAAPIGLGLTRFVSHQPDIAQPIVEGKAMRRIPEGYRISDWTREITPWNKWLGYSMVNEESIMNLVPRDQLILIRRLGLDGQPPSTRAQLAQLISTSPMHTARFERAAIRNLRSIG